MFYEENSIIALTWRETLYKCDLISRQPNRRVKDLSRQVRQVTDESRSISFRWEILQWTYILVRYLENVCDLLSREYPWAIHLSFKSTSSIVIEFIRTADRQHVLSYNVWRVYLRQDLKYSKSFFTIIINFRTAHFACI